MRLERRREMFMVFHAKPERRSWLIALFILLLAIGGVLLALP